MISKATPALAPQSQLTAILSALQAAQVIAYPTEAVFGLGCDPDSQVAVAKLLALKQRSQRQGLILVAADYQQLRPYLDERSLSDEVKQRLWASWPGPINWVLPVSATTPAWLTGRFNTLAVRVSAHPIVCQLSQAFGKPITSTSANLSGLPPCRSLEALRAQFGHQLPVLPGTVGPQLHPCEIWDALTNRCLRQG
jgi:L-threonylcarbamoyladenylate synthase